MSTERLQLFEVTLPWNPDDPDEGDYQTSVWARDADHAIRLAAEEMSQENEANIPEDDAEAQQEFVDNLVEQAGDYAAVSIADKMSGTLRDLMAGPTGELSPQAAADLDTVLGVLAKYL